MYAQSASISSKSSGGDWNSTATWNGGVVPQSGDDVTINGTVTGNGSCNHLTVSAGAYLKNVPGYAHTITVYGNLTNNGTIQNDVSSGLLTIYAYGNITNNGVWTNRVLNLEHATNAHFYQSATSYFDGVQIYANTGKVDTIVFGTAQEFRNCTFTRGGSGLQQLKTNGYNSVFKQCNLTSFDVLSNNLLDFDGTMFSDVHITGAAQLSGNITLYSTNYFANGVVNQGVIKGASGYSVTLRLSGDFTNKNTIYSPSTYLIVYVDGNFHNEGVYRPISTYFYAGHSHILSQTANHPMEGYIYAQETDTLNIVSDFTFLKGPLKGYNSSGNASIKGGSHKMVFDSCSVEYINLFSNDSIRLNKSTLYNGTINGNAKIAGNFDINSTLVWSGNITNYGTCRSTPGYSVTLILNGVFTNIGSISGGYLSIDLYADIENRGIYAPTTTNIKGDKIRSFSQNGSSIFQGNFRTDSKLDGIRLQSNCTFKKITLDGQNATPYSVIETNGYSFSADSCTLAEWQIIGADSLHFNGSLLTNIQTFSTPILTGKITLYSNVTFENGFVNLGYLGPRPGYSVETYVHGNAQNYGNIALFPSQGGVLTVQLFDTLFNAGVYKPSSTYFRGKPNVLSQTPVALFEGNYYSYDTSAAVQLNSMARFYKATLDFQNNLPYTRILTNGNTLHFDTCTVYDVYFKSSDTIDFNGSLVNSSIFYDIPVVLGSFIMYNGVVFEDGLINHGSIFNRAGYGITGKLNGTTTNYGSIATNKSGGNFIIDINGTFINNGIYHPNSTYLKGDTLCVFKQNTTSIFEGSYYAADTNNGIKLGSDVHFKKAYLRWINGSNYPRFNTQGFLPNMDSCDISLVHFTQCDTLDFNGSVLSDMHISGLPVLKGEVTTYSNVRFRTDMVNFGTIQNKPGYGVSNYFDGEVYNFGTIQTHVSGGYLNTYLAKGLQNNAFYQPGATYLVSHNPRQIGGKNSAYTKGNFFVNDSMSFINESILPNLTVNGSSVLTIDTSGQLKCNEINASSLSKIVNNGRIISNIASDNFYEKFYHLASVRFLNNSDISTLEVESFGNDVHPSVPTSLTHWWRFKPNPLAAKDSLKQLYLNYLPHRLAGKKETDLKLYFSENAGLDWRAINRNITLDTVNNRFLLYNAPAYGHYIISDTNIGITIFNPEIHRSEPRIFGNQGEVTIYGFGLGFTPDMKVSLQKNGVTPIYADTVKITDKNGESFLAVFNVDNATVGVYSVVVEVPGQTAIQLSDYMTIEKAERPAPWVMLGGRDRFLLNRWQTFTINYGNFANTDALGVPLFFVVNDVPGMEIEFPDVQIGVPKSFTDDGWTQWQDTTIDLYFVSDSFGEFEGRKVRIYPFYVPSIGALSSSSIRVKIKSSKDLEMTVWVTDPLIEGFEKRKKASTPPEVSACLAKAAAKYSWDKAIGLIPGYDCYKLAYKVTETGVSYALKDANEPEKPETWGSWLISGWGWAWSIADCAGDLIPVSKGVKIAKDLIDIGFDIKSNYDANQECWDKFNAKNKGKHKSRGVTSFDPNEIAGPDGYGFDGYVGARANMVYTVYFENKDTASAPATNVVVFDTLDKSKFDFSTFSFGQVTIADSTYNIQGFSKEFRIMIDLAPRIQSLVQVTGSLDTSNGVIMVSYLTMDRSTLEPNEDVDLGFLPPNQTQPEGEGNFSYSVGLRNGIKHDETISNKALIYFDANPPIATNVHTNKVDIEPPQSAVTMLNAITRDSTFVVEWGGSDNGCGLQFFSVFVSINDSAYVAWKSNTSLVSDTFYGRDHHRYAFYSIATDSLGLTQLPPDNPDASTEVLDRSLVENMANINYLVYPNPAQDRLYVQSNTTEVSKLTAYSLQGQEVGGWEIKPGLNVVKLPELPADVYLVRIESKNGIAWKKIAIVK